MNETPEPTPWLTDPRARPSAQEARLEQALAPLRFDAERHPLALDEAPAPAAKSRRLAWATALAALFAAAGWWVLRERADQPAEQAPLPRAFEVIALQGDASLSSGVGGAAAHERIVCGDGALAHVRVGAIGSLTLEENSRLRLERGGPDGYQVFLEQGALSASIFAAPRVFTVGTPAGLAVDLGCIYRTEVEADGSTRLKVTSGRVSFEADGRRSLVPAGAECHALPGRGPSAPVWSDAPPELQQLALEFDALAPGAARLERMQPALAVARPRDTLTLFHLLERAAPTDRALLVAGLEAALGASEAFETERLLAGDPGAFAALRELLEREW
ncbi:MAG: hypothetical protein FJ299_00095 [Planctomycetes bacterium]|nr:hypothetical protein [Planctomycetota bacterium]